MASGVQQHDCGDYTEHSVAAEAVGSSRPWSEVNAVARRASFAVALVTAAQTDTSPAWPGLFGSAGQHGQYLAERSVDFDVGERVATSRAPIDDRHRDPRLLSPVHEPQPRHHH